jgi:anaerobic magnesium-protoporphyrin IX monomethyl ester cyclase
MRILLIRTQPARMQNTRLPKSLMDEMGSVFPLGIASLAAYLRQKKIPVNVIDADAEGLSLEQLKGRIAAYQPTLVGITSMTPTVHDDLAVARVAKESGALVVMGGPQINALPEETLRYDWVDFGIRGEGEYPLYKLAMAIEGKTDLGNVPGLVYKTGNNRIVVPPPFIHENLNTLPLPSRDLLPYKKYSSLISKGRLTTIATGRGCPFRCSFCFKQPSDAAVRFRAPSLVADEVEEAVARYHVDEINFVSDTMILRKDLVEQLCDEMLTRGIRVSWIAPTRIDTVSPGLLKLMKRAGCRSLRFGIESGSPRILALMNKRLDFGQAEDVFRWTKEAGIEVFAYLIIGYLTENEETVKETLRLVRRLKPDLLMYNIATPLPGTPLFAQAVEAGVVPADYWQAFMRDPNYPRIPYLFKDTEYWIKIAYREFFFSPRVIAKRMLRVRPDNICSYAKALRGILGLRK